MVLPPPKRDELADRLEFIVASIDLFDYARDCVNNKTVLARLGHSATLHSTRSALSGPGAFFSKTMTMVGVAARATLNCIPIPTVGSLISAVEKAIEMRLGLVRK